jgi:oligoribonuclease NrnB/cAMP/cGMP phosphodiesterase (DHH superfamily)
MKLFHLSHTDLDGYGCQFITRNIYKDHTYYNANYGLEVKLFIKDILSKISNLSIQEKIFFLITDLNLTADEAKSLDKSILKLKKDGYDIKLQLLDHHGTGKKSADKFDWYFLDTSRSATKITFDYFNNLSSDFKNSYNSNFSELIKAINAVDIWLEDDNLFEFGKVCMSMISKSYEINNLMFNTQSREYKFFLLNKTLEYIEKENGHILLDANIYHIKKEFLNTTNSDNTIDNLSSQYLVKSLADKKDQFTVYYQDKKGLLTYTLGGISIPANAFLKANEDFDFFIDISRRGRAGFRANNNLDVSILAQKLAGGGGHPNASGAAFNDFKETALYSIVKEFIQTKLDNCN